MFKVFKYLLYASLYKKAKSSFITLFVSLVALLVSSFMMNDLIAISTGITLYSLVIAKWALILILLGLIAWSVLKIINRAIDLFGFKTTNTEDSTDAPKDIRKEKILNKDKLFTKSEIILQKYTKA